MGSDNSNCEHIVMLPFMAHGHLIPFLALARQIQQRTGFIITIATTPLNIQYLKSSFTSSDETNIHLAELPFSCTDHDLPSENSENLTLDQIGRLCAASTSLQTPFQGLVLDITEKEGRPPLCILSDVFFGWANEVAKATGTVHTTFSTCGAYGTLAYISFRLNLPHRFTDSDEFNIPGIPDRCRFRISQLHEYLRKADGTDTWSKFMQTQISLSLQSLGWFCNTFEEVEPVALQWLRNFVKLPVWPTGSLLPPALFKNLSSPGSINISTRRAGKQPGISAEKCLKWLDSQSPGSVLYISFGSQNTISPSQIMQLASGLEASERPFIWVIRPPIGFDRRGDIRAEWLPDEFEERAKISNRGLLVRNWAPQLEILSHKSTGAFLSHCGWNSVLESLSEGVPIIGWPMVSEQSYNSKMLIEEMGVSVELTRGFQDTITWEEVKNVIDLVFDKNGKGDKMKENAKEIRQKIRDSMMEDGEGHKESSSAKAFHDFVSTVLSSRQTTKVVKLGHVLDSSIV